MGVECSCVKHTARSHRRFHVALVFFLSWICVFNAYCLIDNGKNFLRFKHYTVESGLSVNGVYCITQDVKGFMWFGTLDGLNRFDGNRIEIFLPQNQLAGEIGNHIFSIVEDEDDNLWVGTDMGLCIFNTRLEKFELFNLKAQDGTTIKGKVYSIIKSKNGNIWIGTYGQGMFKYDNKAKKLYRYTHNEREDNTLCSNKVRRIYEDSYGDIWITTPDNGYNKYNISLNRFEHYVLENTIGDMRDDVFYEDSQGNFWLGTFTQGLFRLDRQTKEFTGYLQPGSPHHVLHIRSILEYEPGKLLIASDDGLVYFSPLTGDAYKQESSAKDFAGLSNNYLYCIYKDRNRGIWIGTYFGGVNYYTPEFNNFGYIGNIGNEFGKVKGKIVSVIHEDKDRNLWIGTDDAGVIYYNPYSGDYNHYMPQQGKNSLSYHNIHAIMTDDYKVWIGTFSFGLDVLDRKTGLFKNYQATDSPNSLSYSSIYAIYKDHKGSIWVGTPLGLNRYRSETDDFERVKELDGCDVHYITQDKSGYLWVATLADGLFRLDMKVNKWKNYRFDQDNPNSLPSNKTITMAQDERGRLWIGTVGSGICRYDESTDSFIRYSDLELPSGVVHSIIPDYGFLWISTNKGLVKFNPENENLRVYAISYGQLLPDDQFSPNAGLKASDGRLYFGGIKGLVYLSPEKFVEHANIRPVVITKMQIWNKDVIIGDKDSPIKRSIIYQDSIALSYKQSVVSFDLATLNYSSITNYTYKYKLEGFDHKWNDLGEDYHISYTNLSAGDYVLNIMTESENKDEKSVTRSLYIQVLPHPLLSNIAIAIYTIILLILAVLIYRYFVRRVKSEHQKEISIIQANKEKELYNSKLTFFTYLVHEIRTPLSLIIAPLENILKSRNKQVEDVHSELEVMERNSKRILNLVNQLMDFRKVESGAIYLKPEVTEITLLLSNIYNSFKISLKSTAVKFVLELPNEVVWCYVSPEEFTRVISNLLSNAMKFNRGEVILKLEKDDVNAKIYVSDNGIGISKSEQARIFDPFYQVPGTVNYEGNSPGTGIGLTLTKSLVENMKGNLSVESTPEEGTTFLVIFPLSDQIPQQEESEEILVDDILLNTPDEVGRKRILIVDDNEDLRLFLSEQLKQFYIVDTACNGEEGLSKVSSQSYDLIISDIMMPVIDGFEFSDKVKSNIDTSHIPFIMLTAKTNMEARIESLEHGADVYIEKPFSTDFVLAQIKSLLANREAMMSRFSKQPLTSFLTMASGKADQEFLEKLKIQIEENMFNTNFTVEELANLMNMSRSIFYDKVKGISGLTPNELIRVARLKKAAELFATGETRVNEVCYLVGFNSPSYFAKCFYNQFDMLPTDFINYIKKASKDKES